jgi:hypothetical protein
MPGKKAIWSLLATTSASLMLCILSILMTWILLRDYVLPHFFFCDAMTMAFYKVHEAVSQDLEREFTELMKSNTELLEDCLPIEYTRASAEEAGEWLNKHGIEKYKVTYQCDILTFDTELYRNQNNYYMEVWTLTSCGDESAAPHYENVPVNGVSSWYTTRYYLEQEIIDAHIKDRAFCSELKKKIYGEGFDSCR